MELIKFAFYEIYFLPLHNFRTQNPNKAAGGLQVTVTCSHRLGVGLLKVVHEKNVKRRYPEKRHSQRCPPYILQWLLFYYSNLREFSILHYDKSELGALLNKMNTL